MHFLNESEPRLVFVRERDGFRLQSAPGLPESLFEISKRMHQISTEFSKARPRPSIIEGVDVDFRPGTSSWSYLTIKCTLIPVARAFLTELWHEHRNAFVADMRAGRETIRLPSLPHWKAVIHRFLQDLQKQGVELKQPGHPRSISYEDVFGWSGSMRKNSFWSINERGQLSAQVVIGAKSKLQSTQ